MGLGIAYRWLVISLGLNVADLTDNQIYGKSKRFNFGLGATINKSNFSFKLLNFKGFYIQNYEELGLKISPSGLVPNLPNMSMNLVNLNYSYIVNGNKFSIVPYTTGNTVMTKSCGSPILSISLSHYALRNDSAFAPSLSKFQREQEIKSLTSFTPYLSLGYGQNFRLSNEFSLIMIGNAGLGFEKQDYKTNLTNDFSNTSSSYRLDGFGGILYNRSSYFLSLTSEFSILNHNLVKSKFESISNRLTLNMGYRIKSKSRVKWIGNKIDL